MSNNTNQAASKSDRITSHDEKTLDFDRMTLRGEEYGEHINLVLST